MKTKANKQQNVLDVFVYLHKELEIDIIGSRGGSFGLLALSTCNKIYTLDHETKSELAFSNKKNRLIKRDLGFRKITIPWGRRLLVPAKINGVPKGKGEVKLGFMNKSRTCVA